jgi:farnesyl-diphosphate farnesyltransferase
LSGLSVSGGRARSYAERSLCSVVAMTERCFSVDHSSTEDCQLRMLQGVSRTFALAIPCLPEILCRVVTNAYLLCRVADTIEDDAAMDFGRKHALLNSLVSTVEDSVLPGGPPSGFAAELLSELSPMTAPAELELVRNFDRVLEVTRNLDASQRGAICRCLRIMCAGMEDFQRGRGVAGLENMERLDEYCYGVAGVVGEMLTDLFCGYAEGVRKHREALLRLSVSFGQGLQMTNILKDFWEDRQLGCCWLPRDVFRRAGLELKDLSPDGRREAFVEGLFELISVARGHLERALAYTLLIPPEETRIRWFCLQTIGLALLTLRNIKRYHGFTAGSQVKISRRAVKVTVLVTRLTATHDFILRRLFALWALGLSGGRPRPAYRVSFR